VIVLGRDLPDFLKGRPDVQLVDPDGTFHVPDSHDERVMVTLHLPTVTTPGALDAVRRLLDAGIGITSPQRLAKDRYRVASLEGPLDVPPAAGAFSRLTSRAIDIVGSALGCLLLLPLLPLVAIAIRAEGRGPIFFRQERVGRGGTVFRIAKFRTMRTDAESAGARWACAADDRVTNVGAFLRRYRIDELPQLLNVLKGDMSLIGPRPERPEFVPLLEERIPRYDVRHSVRPGMTGWGTVNVGYGNTIDAKYLTHQYDMFHLGHRTIRFDLEILIRTAKLVLTAPASIDHHMS
jgi:lipopolysaccharide/colanic/teichoic acid biosynthesis glycosyltransferase